MDDMSRPTILTSIRAVDAAERLRFHETKLAYRKFIMMAARNFAGNSELTISQSILEDDIWTAVLKVFVPNPPIPILVEELGKSLGREIE